MRVSDVELGIENGFAVLLQAQRQDVANTAESEIAWRAFSGYNASRAHYLALTTTADIYARVYWRNKGDPPRARSALAGYADSDRLERVG
jgi:hypothetical protein